MTPRPVAASRPNDPPIPTGLPVVTPGKLPRCALLYASSIHAISRPLVPISGAGISLCGPNTSDSAIVYAFVKRSNSPRLNFLGSHLIPPFPPPYGRLATAHLKVIHADNAFTSSSHTSIA